MSHLVKQNCIIFLAVAMLCSCNMTTVRKKTFVDYHTEGVPATPIVSYKAHEIHTTIRESTGEKWVFPFVRGAANGDPGFLATIFMLWGIPLGFDLFTTIFIAPFAHTATKTVSYDAMLVLNGKLVDAENKPLAHYRFNVQSALGSRKIVTDEEGVFSYRLTSSSIVDTVPVVFIFPDNHVKSIAYEKPFKSGQRKVVWTSDNAVHTSSIDAKGRVIVLKGKLQKENTTRKKKDNTKSNLLESNWRSRDEIQQTNFLHKYLSDKL
ncbi:MAG: hypothetical protein IKN49_00900 [Elusimicrobiaceae bacterium]|nr:hypothetical protein [Elusimicrobiaceae bacterium]